MGRVTYIAETFIWRGTPKEKDIPRRAGMKYSGEPRYYWWTRDKTVARKLLPFADEEAQEAITGITPVGKAIIEASHALDAVIDIPCPDGLAYRPYQRGALSYIVDLARPTQNALVGDGMRLGKTIEAIGVMNADPTIRKVLVVCPSTPRINWAREIEKWWVHKGWVTIAREHFPVSANAVIVNFERLHKFARAIQATEWDLLIVDEAHRIKNPHTRQSQHAYAIKARRKLYLTGTPIVNRPKEIWPLAHALDPVTFSDERAFMKAYADANPKTARGRQSLARLQDQLRGSIMVRRTFAEVRPNLPPKTREVIEMEADATLRAVIEEEQRAILEKTVELQNLRGDIELAKAAEDENVYLEAVRRLRMAMKEWFAQMSRTRHETGKAKVPYVIAHIKDLLEGGAEKLVVFAHHRAVIDALMEAFGYCAVKIDGSMEGDKGLRERQASVDAFQLNPETKILVGSIQAAGVAITLDAGSHEVFAELDWVTGNMLQAEDRCTSTEKANPILVQHIVLEGSFDAIMAKKLVSKQRVIDAALDAEKGDLANDPIVPLEDEYATADVSRAQIGRDAAKLSDGQRQAVAEAMRVIDRAKEGVNAIDATIAAALAVGRLSMREGALGRHVARKYAEWLPGEIVEAIG